MIPSRTRWTSLRRLWERAREKAMPGNVDSCQQFRLLVTEAFDAMQGPRADLGADIMLRDLRRCVDQLAERTMLFTDPAINALNLLEERLARLEARALDDLHGLGVARLELTQRILLLGQLLFVTPCG